MLTGLAAGCSSSTTPPAPGSPDTNAGASSGAGSNNAGSSNAGSSNAGSSGGDSALPAVPFANGSRELAHVVNIVDAQAAAQLDTYIAQPTGVESVGLKLSANAFYQYYRDEYDFLYFVTDHPQTTDVVARFLTVNREARVGTGQVWEEHLPGYASAGRLKGVIGVERLPDGLFPPIAHETAHYWANFLDPALGLNLGSVAMPDPQSAKLARGSIVRGCRTWLLCIGSTSRHLPSWCRGKVFGSRRLRERKCPGHSSSSCIRRAQSAPALCRLGYSLCST